MAVTLLARRGPRADIGGRGRGPPATPVGADAYAAGMSFRPAAIQGADAGATVDYRLARQALVNEFRKGRLARHEVCDAHPELVRAAQGYCEPTRIDCPICEEVKVVLVSYVFGPYLPKSGRCIADKKEMTKVTRRKGTYTCYVVEVCPRCSWNHLAQTFAVDRG